MQIRNVGELRKLIADLPDDMKVEVLSGSVESLVCFRVYVEDEDDALECYGMTSPFLMISAEN